MKQEFFRPQKLAALRAFHRLDQMELAKQSGLSRPTIQRLENGRTKTPSLETIHALAEYFKVSVNVFFSDEAIQLQ